MPHRARCPASPSIGLSGVCHHQSQDGSQPSLSAKSTTSGVSRRPKTSKAKDAGKKQSHRKYMATPIKKPLMEGRSSQGSKRTPAEELTKRATNGTLGRSLVGYRDAGVLVGQVLRLIGSRINRPIRIRGLTTPPPLQCRRLPRYNIDSDRHRRQTANNHLQTLRPSLA